MGQKMSQIRDEIFKRIGEKALGNSNRGLKEVASDLLNQMGRSELKNICAGTHLSPTTIDRIMSLKEAESGADYSPQSSSLERVFKFCGAEIEFHTVDIKKRFMNKPKSDGE